MKNTTKNAARNIAKILSNLATFVQTLDTDQRAKLLAVLSNEFTYTPVATTMPELLTITEKSSLVRSFGYIAHSQKLTVSLTNNRSYIYHNVPSNVVDEFGKAESAGKFFNQNIRSVYDWAEL